MGEDERLGDSIAIGSSVNSCASIKEVFSDSVDGPWIFQPILVLLCVPRRLTGGLNCSCVWESGETEPVKF